jgi:alkanesulfonate monooxygenase
MSIPLTIFSTCPASSTVPSEAYRERVIDIARWSERHGCVGMLIYTDNSLIDPWLVAQIAVENTESFSPLVAVQPIYMHPYAVAKIVTTFGYLYRRRIWLNMVAGGFKNDLNALYDPTPHDQRYERLREYTLIIRRLLESSGPVTFQGEFYRLDKLKLTPPLPADLSPGILISGSSDAGLATAEAIGATPVKYPRPAHEYPDAIGGAPAGIRVGIIARASEDEAWALAHQRFPEDRRGQIAHQLAMKTSDSAWHQQLSDRSPQTEHDPYWLVPFQNYKTFCPYLVGSYERVADQIRRYIATGHTTFILDIPPDEEELAHTMLTFRRAQQSAG